MPETKTLPNGNRKKVSMDLLFGGLAETTDRLSSGTVLPLAHIAPDPEQPRKTFPPEGIEELAASIREQGVLQPLIVRPQGRDHYVLIAGERRWRAAQMAGLDSVPVVVKDVDGATTRVLSLVENLQREDLRDDEKASALLELKRLRQGTWEDVARWVGLSVPRVKALAQLVKEPAEVTE
jgi:ParB family chromosome partitioning protein